MLPSLPMYDIIILGSGLAGCLCAWHIAKKNPQLKILLLDQNTIPQKKATSMLIPAYVKPMLPKNMPSEVMATPNISNFIIQDSLRDKTEGFAFECINVRQEMLEEWLVLQLQIMGVEFCSNLMYKYYALGSFKCKLFFADIDQDDAEKKGISVDCKYIIDALGLFSPNLKLHSTFSPNSTFSSLTYIKGKSILPKESIYLFHKRLDNQENDYWALFCQKDDYYIVIIRTAEEAMLQTYERDAMDYLIAMYRLEGTTVYIENHVQTDHVPIYGNSRLYFIGDALCSNPDRLFNADIAVLTAYYMASAIDKAFKKNFNAAQTGILYQKKIQHIISHVTSWRIENLLRNKSVKVSKLFF